MLDEIQAKTRALVRGIDQQASAHVDPAKKEQLFLKQIQLGLTTDSLRMMDSARGSDTLMMSGEANSAGMGAVYSEGQKIEEHQQHLYELLQRQQETFDEQVHQLRLTVSDEKKRKSRKRKELTQTATIPVTFVSEEDGTVETKMLTVGQLRAAQDKLTEWSVSHQRMVLEVRQMVLEVFQFMWNYRHGAYAGLEAPVRAQDPPKVANVPFDHLPTATTWYDLACTYMLAFKAAEKQAGRHLKEVELNCANAVVLASLSTDTPLSWGLVIPWIQLLMQRKIAAAEAKAKREAEERAKKDPTGKFKVASHKIPSLPEGAWWSKHREKCFAAFAAACNYDRQKEWPILLRKYANYYMTQLQQTDSCGKLARQIAWCLIQFYNRTPLGKSKQGEDQLIHHFDADMIAAVCVRHAVSDVCLPVDCLDDASYVKVTKLKAQELKKRVRPQAAPSGTAKFRVERVAQVAGLESSRVGQCFKLIKAIHVDYRRDLDVLLSRLDQSPSSAV
jgi:hypothetical protein